MATLTKEAFLQPDTGKHTFASGPWGGDIIFRHALVGDKRRARKLATHDGVLDSEEFECALVVACVLEPQLSEMDLDALKAKSATEMNRLASAIIGVGGNP